MQMSGQLPSLGRFNPDNFSIRLYVHIRHGRTTRKHITHTKVKRARMRKISTVDRTSQYRTVHSSSLDPQAGYSDSCTYYFSTARFNLQLLHHNA
jgi:hypothetical protein